MILKSVALTSLTNLDIRINKEVRIIKKETSKLFTLDDDISESKQLQLC